MQRLDSGVGYIFETWKDPQSRNGLGVRLADDLLYSRSRKHHLIKAVRY